MKLNHLAIPYTALLAFLIGSMAIGSGISWYATLTLPPWHPSTGLIAFIWALVYACAAWSVLIIWNASPRHRWFNVVLGLFIFALLLNLVWSVIFFTFHMVLVSATIAFVLGVTMLTLAFYLLPHSTLASFLLLPFIVWVFFASYLNYVVSTLN